MIRSILSRRSYICCARVARPYSAAYLHVEQLRRIVGQDHLLSSDADLEPYRQDWTKTYVGGSVVCFPKDSHEVSELLKYCSRNKVGVVPQGGNTGLVGGAVGTNKGELIISMKRMNKVIDIDTSAGMVTCEAGCVLEWLNGEVGKHGFTIPLDLGAKGSCMIGGNVATNAGGLRVMKYGTMQGNVLGLEVVLADGTVVDMLRTLRKDNCGLHSKHLFIGSEGTLGVITKVSMMLATKPTYSCALFAKLASFSQVPVLLRAARTQLGDALTAFEFMDRNAVDTVRRAAPGTLKGIQSDVLPGPQSATSTAEREEGIPGEVAILLECTGTDPELDRQRVDAFAQAIMEEGVVQEAVLSLSSQQEKELWRIREDLTLCLAQLARSGNPLYGHNDRPSAHSPMALQGQLFKYDLSVRLADTAELLRRLKQRVLAAGFRMKGVPRLPSQGSSEDGPLAQLFSACELEFCNYGHIADQNIHLNVLAAISTSTAGAGSQGTQLEVPVPTEGEHARYRKPADITAAAGQTIKATVVDPHGASGSADSPMAAVCIDPDSMAAYTALLRNELNRHIFDLVLEMKGSISAEHGVGAQKAGALALARSPAEVALMRALKQVLDPQNILNPGKVLPEV